MFNWYLVNFCESLFVAQKSTVNLLFLHIHQACRKNL